jgi:hypothetical protein
VKTDRHNKANTVFSQFANDPKNININESAKYPYTYSSFQGQGPPLVELITTHQPCAVRSLLLREFPSIDC